MRYSANLASGLVQVCHPMRRVELLVDSSVGSMHVPGVAVHRAIQVPRPLSAYKYAAFGALDRFLHWGRADRQIVAWVRRNNHVLAVHYQDLYGVSTIFGIRALRRLGIPSILTVHNIRPHRRPAWQPTLLRDYVDRKVFRAFDALIVHSDQLRTSLREFLKQDSPPIYIVPHGVGETIMPGPLLPLKTRLAKKRLLFVGAPRANKGLSLLARAVQALPDFSLTIAGFDPTEIERGNDVEHAIANAQRQGARITVLRGYVHDIELDRILRTHSAVVLPYRADFNAQSGVLHQAISYRLPVVVTHVGAIGETVRRFNIGCVVPPGNVAHLADGVRQLYHLSCEALDASLSHAADILAWRSVGYMTNQVYGEVCR